MNQNHDDNMTFTIKQVAKMLGVVSATIRNWEKSGLITVRRSASNYRIFTLDDIELLKKIREYSVDKHMARIANVSLEALGKEIFSASLADDKPADTLLFTDFKDFHIAGHDFGVSQITCLNSKQMLGRKAEFLEVMLAQGL